MTEGEQNSNKRVTRTTLIRDLSQRHAEAISLEVFIQEGEKELDNVKKKLGLPPLFGNPTKTRPS